MKNLLLVALVSLCSIATQNTCAQRIQANTWQVGLGLGELPIGGSLKPSVTLGYHFSKHFYAGVIYQFSDEIQRDNSSFNVKTSELNRLHTAKEKVAQRLLIQGRYQPCNYAPYISLGVVYNGNDVEQMTFNAASRNINGTYYQGNINITQSRKAGWGAALGIGYQYNMKNGLSMNAEWTPAWFTPIPTPQYTFSGDATLSNADKTYLANKMTKGFKGSVTNRYKVFHVGIAYRF